MEYTDLHARLDEENDRKSGKKTHTVSAYRRYFDGWKEYTQTDEHGRKKIIRKYAGDWYIPEGSKRDRALRKAEILLLCTASSGLFADGALRTFMGHGLKINAVLEALCLAALAWLVISCINVLTAGRKMTIYIYRVSSLSLIRSGTVSAAVLFLAAAAAAGSAAAFRGDGTMHQGMLCALEYVLSGACCLIVSSREKKYKIRKESALPSKGDN